MRWTYYILVCNPKAQDRMREEIHRVVGMNRYPTLADRQRLPLCEATIAECMRLASTVPIHFPHMANRDTTIAGYDVPKGTIVAGNLLFLAMDPKVFKDPEVFRPERFLDEAGNYARSVEPFLFGAGKRQCPGEHLGRIEMFIYTTYVVQHFKLRKPPGAPAELQGVLGVTYRPLAYDLQAIDAIQIKDVEG